MQTIESISSKVTETVKPVLASAVEKTTPLLTRAIEGTISAVERIDPDATNRDQVFREGQASGEAQPEESKDPAQTSAEPVKEGTSEAGAAAAESSQPTELQKLKILTEDLLDLWLYEGSKGLQYI